ncbi:8131_t:CDS:1, partial [Racocetra fulgida]
SPYEAFFGFKMRGVYNTPEDTAPDTVQEDTTPDTMPEDTTLDTVSEDTTSDTVPEDTTSNTAPEDTMPNTMLENVNVVTRDISNNQASYEFHALQVKRVHEKIAQNEEAY